MLQAIAEEETEEDMKTYLVEDYQGRVDVHARAKLLRAEGLERKRAYASSEAARATGDRNAAAVVRHCFKIA